MTRPTILYGVIDRRTYELNYSSVGKVEACLQVYRKESLQAWLLCFLKDYVDNTIPRTKESKTIQECRVKLQASFLRKETKKICTIRNKQY